MYRPNPRTRTPSGAQNGAPLSRSLFLAQSRAKRFGEEMKGTLAPVPVALPGGSQQCQVFQMASVALPRARRQAPKDTKKATKNDARRHTGAAARGLGGRVKSTYRARQHSQGQRSPTSHIKNPQEPADSSISTKYNQNCSVAKNASTR